MLNQIKSANPRYLKYAVLAAAIFTMTACLPGGSTQIKIPLQEIHSSRDGNGRVLVVVLPGRGDDVARLKASGITESIQTAMPEADVTLTGVSLAYYMEGRMPRRLREEIILPARQRGYKEIWLAGASMGGMGALMYDREYPGDVTGLVLLAPYLGGRKVLGQIKESGGLENWDAGPVPAVVDGNNFDRELWRYLKSWQSSSITRSDNVWLAYGESDRLSAVMPPLQKLLKPDHVFVRKGGHAWVVWTPAAKEIFTMIEKERETARIK
ncbi:MAG: alpha/beta hydrolase [Arenimonas sp.]